ncbi:glycine oxidase ThiO [Crenothrix sp.]|uniref:glycine oxidase ThiO n=1 Tax=Crenothrix sp. TaxID=3100433 RepID=UPI00374D087E
MTTTPDITIIGGGVIGLLTAREFINAGATVTVVEKNLIGQESSWAGGGILLPLYPWRQHEAISHLVIQSLKLYPALAQHLADFTLINPEWRSCGLLITKNPDVHKATRWCAIHEIPVEVATPTLYSRLNTLANNPLWLPTIGQIRNPRLLKSLKQDLLNKGVLLREHCHVAAATLKDNRITELDTNLGKISINHLVIAAGAWSQQVYGQLFPQFMDISPQIAPIRGQMLLYQAEPDTLAHIILDGDRYLIPRRDGKIVVGSTVENQGFDKSTTSDAKSQLQHFAENLLPSLKKFPLIQHWAGLRPGTHNGVPYISKHPLISNLSINAGHFRNGLVMAPASAQLMADLILNRPPRIDPSPYTLNTLNVTA